MARAFSIAIPLLCVLAGCSSDEASDDAPEKGGARASGGAGAGAAGPACGAAAAAAGQHPAGAAGIGGAGGGVTSDSALIVPAGLAVTGLESGHGVLDVTALTLKAGPTNLELYAALKNVGDIPACGAALSVELFDKNGESLAAGIGGLYTNHLYRLTDGSETIAGCIGPGDVTMATITDLPSSITPESVGSIMYTCSYFAVDVTPIDGPSLGPLTTVSENGGTAYTGTLVNRLPVALANPSVTVFPVNAAGRPLGVASARGSSDMPPTSSIPECGSWAFRTSTVSAPGVGALAFAAGSVAH